ncbi:transposase [Streptomyces sp. LBUM 1488]|nr:transposase [Streptomyces sp. LBUM 1488]
MGRRWSTPPSSVPTSAPPGPVKRGPGREPDDHAIGRSRGGLTIKVHLTADSRCRPLAFVLTPGQAGDAPAFPAITARLRAPRPLGRPRITPDVILADKAYSSRAIRTHLRRRGIRAVIPQPADQAAHRKRRGSRGGGPPALDRDAYKQRNTVERCMCATRRLVVSPVQPGGIGGIFLGLMAYLDPKGEGDQSMPENR